MKIFENPTDTSLYYNATVFRSFFDKSSKKSQTNCDEFLVEQLYKRKSCSETNFASSKSGFVKNKSSTALTDPSDAIEQSSERSAGPDKSAFWESVINPNIKRKFFSFPWCKYVAFIGIASVPEKKKSGSRESSTKNEKKCKLTLPSGEVEAPTKKFQELSEKTSKRNTKSLVSIKEESATLAGLSLVDLTSTKVVEKKIEETLKTVETNRSISVYKKNNSRVSIELKKNKTTVEKHVKFQISGQLKNSSIRNHQEKEPNEKFQNKRDKNSQIKLKNERNESKDEENVKIKANRKIIDFSHTPPLNLLRPQSVNKLNAFPTNNLIEFDQKQNEKNRNPKKIQSNQKHSNKNKIISKNREEESNKSKHRSNSNSKIRKRKSRSNFNRKILKTDSREIKIKSDIKINKIEKQHKSKEQANKKQTQKLKNVINLQKPESSLTKKFNEKLTITKSDLHAIETKYKQDPPKYIFKESSMQSLLKIQRQGDNKNLASFEKLKKAKSSEDNFEITPSITDKAQKQTLNDSDQKYNRNSPKMIDDTDCEDLNTISLLNSNFNSDFRLDSEEPKSSTSQLRKRLENYISVNYTYLEPLLVKKPHGKNPNQITTKLKTSEGNFKKKTERSKLNKRSSTSSICSEKDMDKSTLKKETFKLSKIPKPKNQMWRQEKSIESRAKKSTHLAAVQTGPHELRKIEKVEKATDTASMISEMKSELIQTPSIFEEDTKPSRTEVTQKSKLLINKDQQTSFLSIKNKVSLQKLQTNRNTNFNQSQTDVELKKTTQIELNTFISDGQSNQNAHFQKVKQPLIILNKIKKQLISTKQKIKAISPTTDILDFSLGIPWTTLTTPHLPPQKAQTKAPSQSSPTSIASTDTLKSASPAASVETDNSEAALSKNVKLKRNQKNIRKARWKVLMAIKQNGEDNWRKNKHDSSDTESLQIRQLSLRSLFTKKIRTISSQSSNALENCKSTLTIEDDALKSLVTPKTTLKHVKSENTSWKSLLLTRKGKSKSKLNLEGCQISITPLNSSRESLKEESKKESTKTLSPLKEEAECELVSTFVDSKGTTNDLAKSQNSESTDCECLYKPQIANESAHSSFFYEDASNKLKFEEFWTDNGSFCYLHRSDEELNKYVTLKQFVRAKEIDTIEDGKTLVETSEVGCTTSWETTACSKSSGTSCSHNLKQSSHSETQFIICAQESGEKCVHDNLSDNLVSSKLPRLWKSSSDTCSRRSKNALLDADYISRSNLKKFDNESEFKHCLHYCQCGQILKIEVVDNKDL